MRIYWRFEIFAYLAINELLGIYSRRLEMIISPAISMALAMTLTPLGLILYGSSIELHKVVISGFVVTGMVMGTSISTAYYLVEASLEAIERLLQIPLPRWAVLLARSMSSAVAGIPVPIMVLALAIPYIGFSLISMAAVIIASLVIPLGVIGVASLIGYLVKNLPRLSIAISLSSSALTYLSPLYYPLDVLPNIIRILVMANPASLGVELIRRSIIQGILDINLIPPLLLVNLAWFLTGMAAMLRKIDKR
ncbi:MAG: ABC transporter permease [Sulfolobales archaeon]